jgi:hypothetical protein
MTEPPRDPPRDRSLLAELRAADGRLEQALTERLGGKSPTQAQLVGLVQAKSPALSAAISCDKRFLSLLAANRPGWPGMLTSAFGRCVVFCVLNVIVLHCPRRHILSFFFFSSFFFCGGGRRRGRGRMVGCCI